MTTIPESTWEDARAIFRSLPKEADAITAIAHALHRARQEATEKGWQPIETAPLGKNVDLWCVEADSPATWDGQFAAGEVVRDRFKSTQYGWFGNQSNDGVPRAHLPDLIPVAWREPAPRVPVEMVERFLAGRQGASHA